MKRVKENWSASDRKEYAKQRKNPLQKPKAGICFVHSWLEENEGRENGSEVREIPGGQKVKGIIRHFKDFPFKLSEMGVF